MVFSLFPSTLYHSYPFLNAVNVLYMWGGLTGNLVESECVYATEWAHTVPISLNHSLSLSHQSHCHFHRRSVSLSFVVSSSWSVGIWLSCYSLGKIDGNSFDCYYYLMVLVWSVLVLTHTHAHTITDSRHKHATLHRLSSEAQPNQTKSSSSS